MRINPNVVTEISNEVAFNIFDKNTEARFLDEPRNLKGEAWRNPAGSTREQRAWARSDLRNTPEMQWSHWSAHDERIADT